MSATRISALMRSVSLASVICAVSAPSLAQQAPAAPASSDIIQLDDIVVMGEKIERSLRNTASSVSVLTSSDIDDAQRGGAASVADAIKGTPNLLYHDTVSAPTIRGQDTQGPNFGASAFFGGTVPRAAINVDGHYLSYYESVFGAASIWDVRSIEIFRGPQTAAQGANSIAGAIIVNTKDPVFTREAAAQLQYGSYNSRRASAMLNAPLIENQLAVRLTADYQARDTFIDYINPSFVKGDSDQNFKSLDLRFKLLWEPRELPGLKAKLTLARTDTNRPTSEAASFPYSRLDSSTLSMPSYKQMTNTAIGDLSYDFGNGIKLFNQSQFSDLSVRRVITPRSNGGAYIDQWNASNETRLTFGDENSTLSGVVGAFYKHTKSSEVLYVRGTSDFDDTKNSLGIYSELRYRLTDRWTLTGGLRYQNDQVDRSGTTTYSRSPLAYDKTFEALLPRVSIAYAITPDVTVGALVSKGYNPGGVGLSFAQSRFFEFKEETVWNYELFGRAALLDGRLNVSTNLFYNDFKNSQRLLPDYLNGVLFGAIVVNADKAESYGAEFSADYRVLENLRLRGSLGLLHTEINRFPNNGAVLEGKEFGRAPGYMFSVGVDWDITSQLKLAADLRHTDSYYSTDENNPAYRIGAYTIANARLAYKPTDKLEFFTYANNIFDARKPTWKFDDRTAGGIVSSMAPPREIGIGMKASF